MNENELKNEIKALQEGLTKDIEAKLEAQEKALQEGSTEKAKELTNELKTLETKYADAFNETRKSLDEAHTELKKLKELKNSNKSQTFQEKYDEKAQSLIEGREKGQKQFKDFVSAMEFKAVADMTLGNFSGDPSVSYAPDGIPILNRLNHIRQLPLVSVGSMSTEIFQYERETGGEGTTAFTAEGSAVGQVDSDFTSTEAPARKVGNFSRVSEESLKDVTWLSSFLQRRLVEKVLVAEDAGLLTGDGAGANLTGLSVNALDDAFSSSYAKTAADVNKFDVMIAAIVKLMTTEVISNGILINPIDGAMIYQATASDGQYLSPIVWVGGTPTVYGVPIYFSTAVTAGKYFVADWSMETFEILQRDGLTVSFSDQDADNFTEGMVTVKAQERIALPIYRPASILYGDFANGIASIS